MAVSWCRGHSKLFFLLITVLLLRYSAAGWPGPWPLRPYLDFGATGAPTFNLGVYLGFSTFSLPFSRQVQSLGVHYEQLPRPCQLWPHIRPWGSLIRFSKDSIIDFLTGEYPGDYGGELDISGMAVHPTALWYFAGTLGARVDFIVSCWCGLPSQQVILTGEGTIIKKQHDNLVCLLHLLSLLHHSMPWPLGGPCLHHCLRGPQVAFAAARKQIKGLVSLFLLVCGLFRP